jgi:hypothetical protein
MALRVILKLMLHEHEPGRPYVFPRWRKKQDILYNMRAIWKIIEDVGQAIGAINTKRKMIVDI